MAKIEIFSRDLKGFLSSTGAQHTFVVYTKDNGDRFILRGGNRVDSYNLLNENNLDNSSLSALKLEVVYSPYTKITPTGTESADWIRAGDDVPLRVTIAEGVDSQIDQVWGAMVQEGQRINDESHYYLGLDDNCNSSMERMVKVGASYAKENKLGVDVKEGVLPENNGETRWTPGSSHDGFNDVSLGDVGEKIIPKEGQSLESARQEHFEDLAKQYGVPVDELKQKAGIGTPETESKDSGGARKKERGQVLFWLSP